MYLLYFLIFILFFTYTIKQFNIGNTHKKLSYEMILDALLEPVLVLDDKDRIIQANPAIEQVFGFPIDFLRGKMLRSLLTSNNEIQEKDRGEIIIKNTLKEEVCLSFSKNKVWNRRNKYLGTVIHFKDITQIKEEEYKLKTINKKYVVVVEKLEQIANYDTLTSLPNRRMFLKELSKASQEGKNDFGLIFMDLNGFKEVNDQWGHGVGDQVLVKIARRLKSFEKANNLVARLGGDEFIMLVYFDKKEEIYEISKKIGALISKPIKVGKLLCQISVATGVSIYSENTSSVENMIHLADLAMYQHKEHLGRDLSNFSIQ